MSSVGDAARRYAAAGLAVFPCHSIIDDLCSCGRPDCTSQGKHPLTGNGLHAATSSLVQVDEWWERWPDANVALATGGRVYVVDCDGEAGRAAWRRLVAVHGASATRYAVTGGGGWHVYYLPPAPDLRSTKWRVAEHVDTRGAGGYVLLPPSLHLSGRRYEWGSEQPMTRMPDWLCSLVAPPVGQTPAAAPRPSYGDNSAWGNAALRGELDKVRAAAEGARNDTLNSAAFRIGQLAGGGAVDPRGLADLLLDASTDPDRAKSIQTINRALRDGSNYPRSVPERNGDG